MNSLKGIVFGLVLFVGSFVVLYWNEGRVDKSEIANTATPIEAAQPAPADLQGKLVAASGVLASSEQVGDGLYLAPGPYVAVSRKVEMFAWVEESKSETDVKTGGSEETKTTYTYKKQWVGTPQSSGNFKIPEGHENPTKPLEDNTSYVSQAMVGQFGVDVRAMTLPEFSKLPITAENTRLSDNATLVGSEYVFRGKGTSGSPEVGDIRISYQVLRPGSDVVVFGKASGSKLLTYTDAKTKATLYRMFAGGDKDSAVAQMAGEHNRSLWLFRVLGLLMMWIGLTSIFGPISTILDVLPIFGTISRSAVSAVSFVTALVLSIVTIVISMILHNIIAVILAAAIVVGGAVWWLMQKKKKAGKAIG